VLHCSTLLRGRFNQKQRSSPKKNTAKLRRKIEQEKGRKGKYRSTAKKNDNREIRTLASEETRILC
jgi:hypothetical protein